MKTTIKLLTVIILVIVGFGQHTSASAGGGAAFRFKGRSAVAYFASVDESGCIGTDVYLFGSEAVVSNAPGAGTPIAQSYVYISQYDYCTGTPLLSADGSAWAPYAGSWVDKKLGSATLNTTIQVFDYLSETSFAVDLNLTWTAAGPLTRQNSHSHFQSPGCKINTRSNGSSRFAEASGSVSHGVTNYTPAPSYYADISSLKSGTINIGCN